MEMLISYLVDHMVRSVVKRCELELILT